jgi:AcrR family transcriptional regulator
MLVKDTPRTELGKEDPRVTRTRALLIQALAELMREKSFESITVREIAERATLNRVTFYAHFQDKYDLLEYATREMIRTQVSSQLAQPNPFNPEKLNKLMLLVCNFLTEVVQHCPPPHGQMRPLMEKQIKAELYEIVLSWLQASRVKGAPTAEQTAVVTSWAIYGAAEQWSQDQAAKSAEEFVRQVQPLIMSNLKPFLQTTGARTPQPAALGRAPVFLFPQFHLQFQN